MTSPAAKWLCAETDHVGRVVVGRDLTLEGHPEIFMIGDTALAKDANGKSLPGIAPVAKQQGDYVARVRRRLRFEVIGQSRESKRKIRIYAAATPEVVMRSPTGIHSIRGSKTCRGKPITKPL
jgi:NADH dehydrogenase